MQEFIESVKQTMPELPEQVRSRLLAKGLSKRDVDFLMSLDGGRDVLFDGHLSKGWLSFYEEVSRDKDPKAALNW